MGLSILRLHLFACKYIAGQAVTVSLAECLPSYLFIFMNQCVVICHYSLLYRTDVIHLYILGHKLAH